MQSDVYMFITLVQKENWIKSWVYDIIKRSVEQQLGIDWELRISTSCRVGLDSDNIYVAMQ